MDSEPRTRESRARAEEALVRFALLAGDHATDFVVIGGLNPDFLAPTAPVSHLGTTDVDLLFELGFIHDREDLDFGWLDSALREGKFRALPRTTWRWEGSLGDALVRLDLLCDVPDSPGLPIVLPGASEASAQNLGGPAAALRDPLIRSLTVTDSVRADFPDAPELVKLRFARLGGYIVAKSFALLSRDMEKDAYDLMFVVMFAKGGARAVAAATAAESAASPSQFSRPPYHETVREAMSKFIGADSRMRNAVVRQFAQAGDDADPDQLRIDVVAAARQFLEAFPVH